MAVTVEGWDGNAFDSNSIDPVAGKFIRTRCRLKLSGNYTTGGDTIDWTNGGVNSSVPPETRGIADVKISSLGPSGSVGANGGNYQVEPGSALTNWLLKIFATAGTQYASGSYGSDATSDVICAEVVWAR